MPQPLPSQSFVNIEDIKNEVVYLKGGGLRKVLIVNGINFDLKSEEEQGIILGGFQQFLNTLDYSVQLSIHSRKVNTSRYLENINYRKEEEENDLLRIQITEYIDFVKSFVEENPIISKEFFVVVPYERSETKTKVKSMLGGSSANPEEEQKEPVEKSLEQLQYRVNQVTEGLERIGLRVGTLSNDELVELFYNLYNPELIEKEGEAIPQINPNDQ